MSINCQNLKSCLERSNLNAAYIYNVEVPIQNEWEFEEAVKFPKKYRGNQIHVILKDKDIKKAEHTLQEKSKTEKNLMKNSKDNVNMDNQICQCEFKNEAPPLWFKNYMKKFKHKLLQEVKCNILEAIKPALNEIEKIKINKEVDKTGFQTQFSNQENINSFLGKNIKISQTEYQSSKDSSSVLKEQRDLKLLKKIEKLSLSKLQNLESKLTEMHGDTKYLLDKKKKRLEKKSHAKSKLENKNFDFNQGLKHGLIKSNDSETIVRPGKNFTLVFVISNYGKIPWYYPILKCTSPKGFSLKKEIKLFPLNFQNSRFVIVKGRASKKTGVYTVQCDLLDKDFLLSHLDYPVIVTANDSVPPEKIVKTIKSEKTPEATIKEIEKKLEEINLQQSFSCSPNTSVKLKEKKSKATDAIVNLEESFLKHVKENEKNEVHIYTASSSNNFLDFSKDANTKIEKGMEALIDEKCENMDLIDLESISDSEFSILHISEGEEKEEIEEETNSENFVFLPSPLQEKVQVKDQGSGSTFSTDLIEPLISINSKCKGKNKVLRKEREMKKSKKLFFRSRSPLPDDKRSCKTKKLKSFKSSEYQFKSADLTRPVLNVYIPNSNLNNNDKTFTFTGEHKGEYKTSILSPTKKENKVPMTDCLGRTIYAVSSKGYCLPVETLIKNDKETSNEDNTKFTSVNIFPEALVSGASNMASLAINTAKSVINNLHSAIVKEGTELGKPADEPKTKSPSMEALYKLYEMGFTDLQVNRNLLSQQDNDLSKVIEELLILKENSKGK